MYKISVIVPVYNAESTLDEAVRSIISQTIGFEHIELILVDDNSSDSSKEIILSYSNKYDNIKPIFLERNTGSPSMPRNVGIDNASAPYIMFLDNDDEFVEDCCKTVYDVIINEQCDIVNISYCRKFISGYYAFHDSEKYQVEVDDPISLRFTVWGNIFRTDFIKKNDIRFPDSLYEDGVFCIKAFTKTNNIIQLPNYIGYIYTVEKEEDYSITHNTKLETILNFMKGYKYSNEYLTENKLDKQRLIDDIPMIYFMFFKFKGSMDDKLFILKEIHNLEKSFQNSINIPSKPINILNNFVLNEKYYVAIFISFIARMMYNNNLIRKIVFKHYSNIKKINLK